MAYYDMRIRTREDIKPKCRYKRVDILDFYNAVIAFCDVNNREVTDVKTAGKMCGLSEPTMRDRVNQYFWDGGLPDEMFLPYDKESLEKRKDEMDKGLKKVLDQLTEGLNESRRDQETTDGENPGNSGDNL